MFTEQTLKAVRDEILLNLSKNATESLEISNCDYMSESACVNMSIVWNYWKCYKSGLLSSYECMTQFLKHCY